MSDKKKSLREDEIVTERNMGRRSLLGIVGGGLLLGTALSRDMHTAAMIAILE